ncbi:YncE family protein [Bifidobacterium leontopitheci]|nr:PD40 domain-containing protein [Bifidobacterium leontopitheci]
MQVLYGDPCFDTEPPIDLAVSPDSSTLVLFNGSSVDTTLQLPSDGLPTPNTQACVIDAATMKVRGAVDLGFPLDTSRPYRFSPDGSRLYVTSSAPRTPAVIDVRTPSVRSLGQLGAAELALSADGAQLLGLRNAAATQPIQSGSKSWVLSTFTADSQRRLADVPVMFPYAVTDVDLATVSHDGRTLYAFAATPISTSATQQNSSADIYHGRLAAIRIADGSVTDLGPAASSQAAVTADRTSLFYAAGDTARDPDDVVSDDTHHPITVTFTQVTADTHAARSVIAVSDVDPADLTPLSITDDGRFLSGVPGMRGNLATALVDVRGKRYVHALDSASSAKDDTTAASGGGNVLTPDGTLQLSASAGEWKKRKVIRLSAGNVGGSTVRGRLSLDFGRVPVRPKEPVMTVAPDGKTAYFIAGSAKDDDTDEDGTLSSGSQQGCGGSVGGGDCQKVDPVNRGSGLLAKVPLDGLRRQVRQSYAAALQRGIGVGTWLSGAWDWLRGAVGRVPDPFLLAVAGALVWAVAVTVALVVWFRRGGGRDNE